jgi:hypothetical protein
LVLEPYQPAMFHSGLARTVRPTSASPAHVRPRYAQIPLEGTPRGCHEAVRPCTGTVKGCTGDAKRAVRPWSGHGDAPNGDALAQLWSGKGQDCGSLGAAKGKAEKSPEIFWRRGSL